MGLCNTIPKKKDKICIGDLDSFIKIQIRTKITPGPGETVATMEVTDDLEVWARHDSSKGEVVFDSSNMEQVSTDKFYIRFIPNISVVNSLEKNGKRYKVIDIEDLNGNEEFLLIRTSRRGSSAIPNNYI